jgi:hypothetical protein
VLKDKFQPKYKGLFTQEVMNNWNSWLSTKKAIFTGMLNTSHSNFKEMELPAPYKLRQKPSVLPETSLEDFASADMPDGLEYVTHASGSHGSFTQKQRHNLIRHTLLDELENEMDAVILENKACIYKFVYEGQVNMSVGIVTVCAKKKSVKFQIVGEILHFAKIIFLMDFAYLPICSCQGGGGVGGGNEAFCSCN